MKKFLVFISVMLLLFSMVNAQQKGGNIEGKVLTADGEPMPGVLVVLTSTVSAKMQKISNESGVFRFRQLAPGSTYKVVAKLEGFKTFVQPNIAVKVGANTKLNVKMVLGKLVETVKVVGTAPVVDAKTTQISTTLDRKALQSLPTGRDPFSIMGMAPGVASDRVNMAGSESGQQSTQVGRGEGSADNNTWNVDGVNVTDPAAIGGSPTYWDFDAFEEISVGTGGSDVTNASGGIQLNLVTRRGGNKTALGGRFYVTDSAFQDEFTKDDIKELKVPGTIGIRDIKDFGFNLGGSLIPNKIFYWMSYGVQDIKTKTIGGENDDTLLKNYVFKLNFQLIESNRLEFFLHVGGKTKSGRNIDKYWPKGLGQGGQHHFGSPIMKIQDEMNLGDNLFISLKYAYTDAGFKLWSMVDPDMNNLSKWDMTTEEETGSYYKYDVKRPKSNYAAHITYFNDDLLGGTHEIKLGAEYTAQEQEVAWGYSGAGGITMDLYNFPGPMVDKDRDGKDEVDSKYRFIRLDRSRLAFQKMTIMTGFLQDTMSYGNLTIKAGLRYDKYSPELGAVSVAAIYPENGTFKDNFDANTISTLGKFFPGAEIPVAKPSEWAVTNISPRLGLTYDVGGEGKNIIKISMNRFGGIQGVALANSFSPSGTVANIGFHHWDENGDGLINLNELYVNDPQSDTSMLVTRAFDDSGNFIGDFDYQLGSYSSAIGWWGVTMFSGFELNDPTKVSPSKNLINGQYAAPTTTELLLTYERELSNDFSVQLNATYRKTDGFWWNNRYFKDGTALGNTVNSKDWYGAAGTVPSSIPGSGVDLGEAAGKTYYLLKDEYKYSGGYEMYEKRPDFNQTYMGFDLILNKRLSNRWRAQASFTYQDQANNYGDNGYLDPTNLWAQDGKPFAPFIGGSSGRVDQYVFARWMVKATGLYQLPWDVDFSFNFFAREGNIIQRSIKIKDQSWSNWKNDSTVTVLLEPFGKTRLDTLWNLDIRLQKKIRIGENQTVYLMFDLFNALNNLLVDGTHQLNYGKLTRYADGTSKWTPKAIAGATSSVLSPRVFRLGVRFQF